MTTIADSGEVEGVRRAPEFADDVALLLLVLPETLFRAGASGISQLRSQREYDSRNRRKPEPFNSLHVPVL